MCGSLPLFFPCPGNIFSVGSGLGVCLRRTGGRWEVNRQPLGSKQAALGKAVTIGTIETVFFSTYQGTAYSVIVNN